MTSELTSYGPKLPDVEWQLLVALVAAYRPNNLLQLWADETADVAASHATTGRDFDFVFIDAVSLTDWRIADMLPFLEQDAYILIHHAAHHRVAAAIDAALAAHPDELVDCGMLGRTGVWDVQRQAHYQGLRLLRYTRRRGEIIWQREGA